MWSERAAHDYLALDLEDVISRHFAERYYSLLLLPNCHKSYSDGWITEIQILMRQHGSLRYSVLANGASHIHFSDNSNGMQELALTYYSKALSNLSKIIENERQVENHNGFLMSVILLYLHGCMGRGTYTDIPKHVNAATRVLALRLFDSTPIITTPFDRLAVESVIYQMFLLTTGLWTQPTHQDDHFDERFWLQAEKLLDRSVLFEEGGHNLNSPVLGAPVCLFRLALELKQWFRDDTAEITHTRRDLGALRSEVEDWESMILLDEPLHDLFHEEFETSTSRFYRDGTSLYILIVSMLLTQIQEALEHHRSLTLPTTVHEGSWQLAMAMQILYKYKDDDDWKMCFIGAWQIYTLGFLVSTPEHIELVRHDLYERWQLTRFSNIERFRVELEQEWMHRGLLGSSIVEISIDDST